ncbi:MAG: TIM barrel protein [Planctomycetes bacterium]|nr:TIM barrel protein [Planctomycetota bacterium]MCH9727778.1 TIM barrel protein [Planctomycetota bacterium]MCH9776373.1 TIM barrel protein [Planctomycetota bacterium]MCH9790100.1 TIM barrel protein [Planctomycetota bacterium]
MNSEISRRKLLQNSGVMAATALGLGGQQAYAGKRNQTICQQPLKGDINQSVVHWCFKKYWDIEQTAQVASQLGMKSVELTPPENWGTLKKYGLTCAIASSHGFKVGFNNPKHWDQCIEILRKRIDDCAAGGVKNVITFTGMRDGISDEAGAKNCVAGFKKIVGYAEKKKVNLCLEMLNSRDDSHPMKGHPGYQGDNTEYCIDIIKQVGSDRMKLLFDIYHVQIMDGDVIRRIREHKDYIGHVHTAGNPGRGELDQKQEINYPPIMQALLDIGYQGHVGQEFIPTIDPYQGLKQAVELCDV